MYFLNQIAIEYLQVTYKVTDCQIL